MGAMILETKLQAFCSKNPLGAYKASVQVGENGQALFCVHPNKGEGTFTWYLSTILRGYFSSGKHEDVLSLDFGADWYVTGMRRAVDEVVDRLAGKILSGG